MKKTLSLLLALLLLACLCACAPATPDDDPGKEEQKQEDYSAEAAQAPSLLATMTSTQRFCLTQTSDDSVRVTTRSGKEFSVSVTGEYNEQFIWVVEQGKGYRKYEADETAPEGWIRYTPIPDYTLYTKSDFGTMNDTLGALTAAVNNTTPDAYGVYRISLPDVNADLWVKDGCLYVQGQVITFSGLSVFSEIGTATVTVDESLKTIEETEYHLQG